MIDFDSSLPRSTEENKVYAGIKCSSGNIPPELVHKFTKKNQQKLFETHFKEAKEAGERKVAGERPPIWTSVALTEAEIREESDVAVWERIKPVSHGRDTYCIKTYKPSVDSDNLPYELVEATEKIDIWGFGSLLYALTAGTPVFHVNREDALNAGSAYKKLEGWTDGKKMVKLDENKECANDVVLKDLLMKLLSRDPRKRPDTMAEVLEHAYFNPEKWKDREEEEVNKEYEDGIAEYENELKRGEASRGFSGCR